MIHFKGEVSSTMDAAKEILEKKEDKPFGVVGEVQLKGRGSGDRVWTSPKGNLYFTLAIPEKLIPKDLIPVTPLLMGIASHRAVLSLLPSLSSELIRTKWPNDLIFDHKKLGGSIVEVADGFTLIGIGINVHLPPVVGDDGRPSTCLDDVVKSLAGETLIEPNVLATALWNAFFGLVCDEKATRQSIVQQFESLMDKSLTLYRRLPSGRDTTPLTAIRLNEWGHLIVRSPDGLESTLSAEYLF